MGTLFHPPYTTIELLYLGIMAVAIGILVALIACIAIAYWPWRPK